MNVVEKEIMKELNWKERIIVKIFKRVFIKVYNIMRIGVINQLLKWWLYHKHFDKRFGTPACSSGGFPTLRRGSISNYVCILQDDLNTLGYPTGGLDGIFGNQTDTAVRNYQRKLGITVDGIVGCNTWRSLQEAVVGTGATSTTIN